MIDELLVSFLNGDSGIAAITDAVSVGFVPRDVDGTLQLATYIWLSNFSELDDLTLAGTSGGLTEYQFDIECCSTDPKVAKTLARLVKKRLQGYGPGDFGSVTPATGVTVIGKVAACYIESKDDSYTPVNRFSNDDITVVAQDLRVFADDLQDDFTGV